MSFPPSERAGLVPSAVDTLPINLAILDEEGEIQWTNRAWQEFGRENEIGMRPDTVGVNYLEVTANGDNEFSRRAYEALEALLSGDVDEVELEYPCHSRDEFRWFLMQAATYTIDEHRFVTVAHIDITERKLQERELQTFKEAAEQSGHSILITDRDGVIVYVNPTFEETTGYSREEAIGKTPRILRSGEHGEEFYRELWETITAGEVWEREIVNERKDGDRFVVDQTIAPITDEDGTITHFVGINQEITERVTYEKRLEEQRDNLEILNEVVRHDIRNDIQLIQTYTELLENHIDEEGQSYLETIKESAENAVDLTRTARDLAEVMLRADADTTLVALDRTLHSQVEELRATHPDAEITVEGSLPNVQVRANDMLDAVFRNVLQNAIQHNNKDVPQIRISVEKTDTIATIEIADNGPGIPDSQKEDIFGKGAKGLDSQGTGIGLYLVRELVEGYGGDVWVKDGEPDSTSSESSASDAEANEGSIFVIELPIV